MSEKQRVKVGRLLLLSHGAYSSYERLSWFVAVQDFCPDDELETFMAGRKPEDRGDTKVYGPEGRFDYHEFLAWLTRKGLMVEVEEFFDEWHLGDYGRADEVSFMPRTQNTSASEQQK